MTVLANIICKEICVLDFKSCFTLKFNLCFPFKIVILKSMWFWIAIKSSWYDNIWMLIIDCKLKKGIFLFVIKCPQPIFLWLKFKLNHNQAQTI